MFWSSSSRDKISYRARKYIGNGDFLNSKEVFEKAYKRLKEVVLSIDSNLVGDLHCDMQKTIDSVEHDIQFLFDEGGKSLTRKELIVYIQAWGFSFTEEAKRYVAENGNNEVSERDVIDWLVLNYNWPIKSDPIPSWEKRMASLKTETNRHLALKRYCDFMRQTEKIRSQISEASYQLDSLIQQEIDCARGK